MAQQRGRSSGGGDLVLQVWLQAVSRLEFLESDNSPGDGIGRRGILRDHRQTREDAWLSR
jgi:hypothetical protein